MKVLLITGDRIESESFYSSFVSNGHQVIRCHVHDLSNVENLDEYNLVFFNFFHDLEFNRRFAKKIVYGVDQKCCGINIWPDLKSCLFYDDKLAQVYQFLSLKNHCKGVRLAGTKVFYTYRDFKSWMSTAELPAVVKLSTGAGSHNVKLLSSRFQAMLYGIINFTIGRSRKGGFSILMDRLKNRDLIGISRSIMSLMVPSYKGLRGRERGYVIVQEYLPGNDGDIRIVVIGQKAIAIKRRNRPHDFRASGSGLVSYDVLDLPTDLIKASFDLSKLFSMKVVAFDFLRDERGFVLIESSYTISYDAYDKCKGYWDSDGNWKEGKVNVRDFIVNALSHT